MCWRLSCRAVLKRTFCSFCSAHDIETPPLYWGGSTALEAQLICWQQSKGGCPQKAPTCTTHMYNLIWGLRHSQSVLLCGSTLMFVRIMVPSTKPHRRSLTGWSPQQSSEILLTTPFGFLWSFQQGFTLTTMLALYTEPWNEPCYLHTPLRSPVSPILCTAMCILEYCK